MTELFSRLRRRSRSAREGHTATGPCNDAPYRLISEVAFADDVIVHPFTNLYGCRIGARTRIGPFVEIQRGATIGADCKIQSHAFVCDGVKIGDQAFVGHGVIFINDNLPRATTEGGELRSSSDWDLKRTTVERGASLGSGAVILGGLRIGEGAIVGAGAVVTRDVPPGDRVAGNPARAIELRRLRQSADQLVADPG
jgi:UDP-2-acetamido-3-amino-2,3-dideoxy-glucuronate N-acetyltransferase